jgi:CheY-like chemotaxis protein
MERNRELVPIWIAVTAADWKDARRVTVAADDLRSTFQVRFTRDRQAGGSLTPAITRQLIGVIDDDASIRKALAVFLRAHGFRVQAFDCAEAFLARGRGDAWHCLVVDLGLPGLSGFDLQAQLSGSGPQVPVIFISALDDRTGVLAGRAARQGARALLQKPFPMKQLLSEIEKI